MVPFDMAHYGTAWDHMVLHGTAWYSTAQHGAAWLSMVPRGSGCTHALVLGMASHYCCPCWELEHPHVQPLS